jgi:hypothetical protein
MTLETGEEMNGTCLVHYIPNPNPPSQGPLKPPRNTFAALPQAMVLLSKKPHHRALTGFLQRLLLLYRGGEGEAGVKRMVEGLFRLPEPIPGCLAVAYRPHVPQSGGVAEAAARRFTAAVGSKSELGEPHSLLKYGCGRGGVLGGRSGPLQMNDEAGDGYACVFGCLSMDNVFDVLSLCLSEARLMLVSSNIARSLLSLKDNTNRNLVLEPLPSFSHTLTVAQTADLNLNQ